MTSSLKTFTRKFKLECVFLSSLYFAARLFKHRKTQSGWGRCLLCWPPLVQPSRKVYHYVSMLDWSFTSLNITLLMTVDPRSSLFSFIKRWKKNNSYVYTDVTGTFAGWINVSELVCFQSVLYNNTQSTEMSNRKSVVIELCNSGLIISPNTCNHQLSLELSWSVHYWAYQCTIKPHTINICLSNTCYACLSFLWWINTHKVNETEQKLPCREKPLSAR